MRQVGTILSQSVLAATVLHSLIIFLHPTASATPQQTARGIYLFSVRNSRSTSGDPGVVITITRTRNYYEPPNGDSVNGNESSISQQTYFIPNRSLSSECGDQYFRCQNLSVKTFLAQDGVEFDIVFVPLENGVLLVSIWRDFCTGMLELSKFIVDSPIVTCSPTVIYHETVNNSFYTVCVSTRDPYVYNASVYHLDFKLNGSEIKSGLLSSHPLTFLTFMTNQPSKLSNFLVAVSSQENKVYFAVGGSLLVLDVLNPTETKNYEEFPNCSQINKLVLSDESSRQVIAFCNDQFVRFDPVYGDWTQMHTFSKYGIPFLCPNSSYKVTFFNDESRNCLQLIDSGSVLTIIHNVTVSSGICFEIQNITYFAYSDKQQNNCVQVSLYNFSERSYYPLNTSECSNATDHPQFLLIENRFLVVYTEHEISILDAKNNFSPLINISQDVSPFTVLTLAPPVCMTTSTLSSTFNTYTNSTLLQLSPTSFKLISRTTPLHTLPCTSCNNVSSKVEPRTTSIAPTDITTTPNTQNHQGPLLTGILTTGAVVSVIIIVSLNVVIGIFIKFRRKLW